MIRLLLGNDPAPATFAVGGRYVLGVDVEGATLVKALYDIGRRAEAKRHFIDKVIFEPESAEPYYLHVEALTLEGETQEAIFILQATTTGGATGEVTVTWSEPAPRGRKPLTAVILGPKNTKSIGWALLHNNVPVQAGASTVVTIPTVTPGIYRVLATVLDSEGNTSIADSSTVVPFPFGLQSVVTPQQPVNETLYHIGDVYSPLVEGGETQCSYLPYELTNFMSVLKLMPGTTHFKVELDPVNADVDDEVVVRTAWGNWTLKGPPTGLSTESLPYDYRHGQPVQPAALDLSVRYSVEALNVHGSVANAYKFRVVFRCYRAGLSLFRYSPCDWSAYYGGRGERQGRMIALITNVDLILDTEWPDNRLGSRELETFTVPNQQRVIGQFSITGKPDQPFYNEDHFFTDQNALARYESPGGILNDLTVSCAYGLAGVRPCYLDFSQPTYPRAIQRVKQLYGKLVLYAAGGAFTRGTTITATIYTGKSPGYVTVTVPITADVYNPDYASYGKIGEADIAISDFEFDRVGVLIDLAVNSTAAAAGTAAYNPLHQVGDAAYYSTINAPAIKVDTACYRDPVPVPVFEGTFAGSSVPLPDCNRLPCGPVGIYCYTRTTGTDTTSLWATASFRHWLLGDGSGSWELANASSGTTIGSEAIRVAQPFGFPASYVALVNDQTKCYSNPIFLYEATSESAGSNAVIGYGDTTECGTGYLYDSCNHAHSLAVIYPSSATPHATISFGGTCWGLNGSIADLRPYRTVIIDDVLPVASCVDVICTGSDPFGPSVLYMDNEAQVPVTVQFEHLDSGIPAFGVARENYSTGYSQTPPGSKKYQVWNPSVQIFSVTESGDVAVRVEPTTITREVVVLRNGSRLRTILPLGTGSVTLPLVANDVVFLEFGNNLNRYKGTCGVVSWERVVAVPRLYDTATLSFTGSLAIKAVGFTGLTNRHDYAFYDNLPVSVKTDLPNPDTILTVQSGTATEMELLRSEAIKEPTAPFHRPRYAGQKLASPVTFRFYAARSRAGQHGEMDVWLEEDQSFPAYLRVSPYKVLTYGGYSYRKSSSSDDTTRRGLRVVTSDEAAQAQLPGVYVSNAGERIVAASQEDFVFLNSEPYAFTGTLDSGISDTIYSGLEEMHRPQHVRQFNLTGSPHGVTYVPATDEIWTTTSAGIEIVSATGAPGVSIISASPFYDIAWCAATGEVMAVTINGAVIAYDPATRLPTKGGSTFGIPTGSSIGVAVRGSTVYVGANMPDATLYGLRASDLTIAETHSTGLSVNVKRVVYLSSTDQILLGTESGGSWLLGTDLFLVNVGLASTTAWGFCDAPDRRTFYVASASFPGSVAEVDPATLTVLRSFATTNSARNPFWHPLRKKIYYGQYINGLEEIRDPNGNLLSSVYIGEWSFATAYAPNHRLVFVSLPAINALVAMT